MPSLILLPCFLPSFLEWNLLLEQDLNLLFLPVIVIESNDQSLRFHARWRLLRYLVAEGEDFAAPIDLCDRVSKICRLPLPVHSTDEQQRVPLNDVRKRPLDVDVFDLEPKLVVLLFVEHHLEHLVFENDYISLQEGPLVGIGKAEGMLRHRLGRRGVAEMEHSCFVGPFIASATACRRQESEG